MIDLKGYEWQLVEGSKMTVVVAVLSFGVAILFGLIGAAGKLSLYRPVRSAADTYTVVIRGVPELILLILFYFGGTILLQKLVAAFGPEQRVDINPFIAGVLAIGFIYGAFVTEVFRGAILAVPKGQIEAAKACGMSDFLIVRRVLLPQVWRFAVPGLGNVWLVLLKATALISVVNLDELARKSTIVANNTKQHFTVFFVAAIIYLVLTAISSVGLHWLERQANRGVRRA